MIHRAHQSYRLPGRHFTVLGRFLVTDCPQRRMKILCASVALYHQNRSYISTRTIRSVLLKRVIIAFPSDSRKSARIVVKTGRWTSDQPFLVVTSSSEGHFSDFLPCLRGCLATRAIKRSIFGRYSLNSYSSLGFRCSHIILCSATQFHHHPPALFFGLQPGIISTYPIVRRLLLAAYRPLGRPFEPRAPAGATS